MQPDGQIYGDVEERVKAEDVERLRKAEAKDAERLGSESSRIARGERSKIARSEGKVPRDVEAK